MRKCLLVLLLCFLSACVTEKNSVRGRDEKAEKISTAKINAQLGMAYLKMQNVERAKTKLLAALSEAPDIPEPWYAMGYFLEQTGNVENARKHYLKAVHIAPHRGDVQNNYGTFLCRNGEFKEAINHFLLASKDAHYLTPADAYENAGVCALKIPDRKLAAFYFKKAIQEDPTRPDSFLALARLNYSDGNLKGARNNLDQFLAMASPTTESLKLADSLGSSHG